MAELQEQYEVRLTDPAKGDLSGVMEWTFREFGRPAALHYDTLIKQALKDIGVDPERHGSRSLPQIMLSGARVYHLQFSRSRVRGRRVSTPRHFLLYRRTSDGVIEVARILHDSRDLERHLPEDYRRIEPV